MQQQQQQPASSSPRLAPYGEYIPLRLRVRDLEEDQRLKALVDERVLKLHYDDMPVAVQRDKARPKTDLFVFHVPKGMEEGELYRLFSRHGKLRRVRIQFNVDKDTNETKGYAFVTFKDLSDAVVAVHRLDGYPVSHLKTVSMTENVHHDYSCTTRFLCLLFRSARTKPCQSPIAKTKTSLLVVPDQPRSLQLIVAHLSKYFWIGLSQTFLYITNFRGRVNKWVHHKIK